MHSIAWVHRIIYKIMNNDLSHQGREWGVWTRVRTTGERDKFPTCRCFPEVWEAPVIKTPVQLGLVSLWQAFCLRVTDTLGQIILGPTAILFTKAGQQHRWPLLTRHQLQPPCPKWCQSNMSWDVRKACLGEDIPCRSPNWGDSLVGG